MSNSDSFEDNYFDEAERALSKNNEKTQGKKEEKNKIPPGYLLTGASLILIVVLAIQFLFQGETVISEPIIPQEVHQQFDAQLAAFSRLVEEYRLLHGVLPRLEEEFLGFNDPVIAYTQTGPDSYTLAYTFGDSSLVLESTIETETDIGSPPLPTPPPVNAPERVPTSP